MKKWVRKKGRVAAGVSISLHAAVYLSLAAGGFFTLLSSYTRQGDVTDIMVYDVGDVGGIGGENDQSNPSGGRCRKAAEGLLLTLLPRNPLTPSTLPQPMTRQLSS